MQAWPALALLRLPKPGVKAIDTASATGVKPGPGALCPYGNPVHGLPPGPTGVCTLGDVHLGTLTGYGQAMHGDKSSMNLRGANLSWAQWDHVVLNDRSLVDGRLRMMNLHGADFTSSTLPDGA
jgi:hypothetical protein